MPSSRPSRGWIVWLTFIAGLLLTISPLPQFMEILRPMWLALLMAFWSLELPQKIGMVTAWLLGLCIDVLYGTLLGQNALILTLITFLVLSLQQRMRTFPMWQQSLIVLVVFGLAPLLLPALVSALLWPWVSFGLRGLARRYKIN
jgi:rod shape-determining protein MreD